MTTQGISRLFLPHITVYWKEKVSFLVIREKFNDFLFFARNKVIIVLLSFFLYSFIYLFIAASVR